MSDTTQATGQERAKQSTDLLAKSATKLRQAISLLQDARADLDVPLTSEEIGNDRSLAEIEVRLLRQLNALRDVIVEARYTQAAIENPLPDHGEDRQAWRDAIARLAPVGKAEAL